MHRLLFADIGNNPIFRCMHVSSLDKPYSSYSDYLTHKSKSGCIAFQFLNNFHIFFFRERIR